jgi:2-C-methyl-D-erythritol 2,4-cyclodiphosphate synthase
MRIGIGYDVHRLCPDRKLVLGGVYIPHESGLLGHSDADVLLHAISDALLGAASLGDIGRHFPDSDNAYKGIDSMILLKKVGELIEQNGYKISNIDATVVCQRPKLAPYAEQMRINISTCLKLDVSQVNIKATTTETLGFEGRKEGISSHAVCLIQRG